MAKQSKKSSNVILISIVTIAVMAAFFSLGWLIISAIYLFPFAILFILDIFVVCFVFSVFYKLAKDLIAYFYDE